MRAKIHGGLCEGQGLSGGSTRRSEGGVGGCGDASRLSFGLPSRREPDRADSVAAQIIGGVVDQYGFGDCLAERSLVSLAILLSSPVLHIPYPFCTGIQSTLYTSFSIWNRI